MSLQSIIAAWPAILGTLAIVLLLSGVDDLVPVLICLTHWIRHRKPAIAPSLGEFLGEERRIAIFVPCWKESGVIGNMVRHNVAAIGYRNYDFFLGVYPNDGATVEATERLAETFRNVHVAECPHPGPTSKADCLNWIYQRMTLFEEETGARFDTVVLHDAEDLIHPEALSTINRERATYAMVQIPVLPLPTPFGEFTHAVYCDEFAEFQRIDMLARQYSGSFIPSNGVGTGFAREILERLASERDNLVFDAASLTEDYEIGVHIHEAGQTQLFAPLKKGGKGYIATREYFPRTLRSAIRQRTRWVTGIALQCWERHGWGRSWRTRYWFWRDRKGLIANPVSLLTNLLFLVGAGDWIESLYMHRPWAFAVENPGILALCWVTLGLQSVRLTLRAACVAGIFGLGFAVGVPLRCFHGNLVNCCASMGALWRFLHSKAHRRPLVWLKTEHAYPSRDALLLHRRELDEVLVASGYLSKGEMAQVRAEMRADGDLAEHLVASGRLSDDEVCKAMSLQSGVPSGRVDTRRVKARIARTLPAHVEERFGIVPFGVERGRLLVAGASVPPANALEELKAFTRLQIEFQLVTKRNYQELRALL
ncbi:MAG: glycosyl transferase family protein [Acidobacteriaceae bacterium]|nr:glycosyl transferase family protein [Acidobacteriaceae bacterium]